MASRQVFIMKAMSATQISVEIIIKNILKEHTPQASRTAYYFCTTSDGETRGAVSCKTDVNRKSHINAYLEKSGVYSPDFQGKGFFLLKAERAGADQLLRPPAIPPAATGDRLAHIAVPAGLQTDFYSRCHCRPRRVAVHVLDGKADRETGRNKHLLTSYTTKLTLHSAKLTSHTTKLTPHSAKMSYTTKLTPHSTKLTSYTTKLTPGDTKLTSYTAKLTCKVKINCYITLNWTQLHKYSWTWAFTDVTSGECTNAQSQITWVYS